MFEIGDSLLINPTQIVSMLLNIRDGENEGEHIIDATIQTTCTTITFDSVTDSDARYNDILNMYNELRPKRYSDILDMYKELSSKEDSNAEISPSSSAE